MANKSQEIIHTDVFRSVINQDVRVGCPKPKRLLVSLLTKTGNANRITADRMYFYR